MAASSIAIDGVAIEPGGGYRVAVNSYLADGGSGFSVLEEGSARNGGGIDLDALAAYFAKAGAVAPGPHHPPQLIKEWPATNRSPSP